MKKCMKWMMSENKKRAMDLIDFCGGFVKMNGKNLLNMVC